MLPHMSALYTVLGYKTAYNVNKTVKNMLMPSANVAYMLVVNKWLIYLLALNWGAFNRI